MTDPEESAWEPPTINLADGCIEDCVREIQELDEDQFARSGFKVSQYAAQRVRESPGLRNLFQLQALGDDMEKAELARKILQAAREFKYPGRESL